MTNQNQEELGGIMTSRPAFFPCLESVGVDDTQSFNFVWNPGFAFSQKQKNVQALHESIRKMHPNAHPLEVSSKSFDEIGVQLSAFNLSLPFNGESCVVESIFQASKKFEDAGPFPELYSQNPRLVRDYVRENAKGKLIAFKVNDVLWSLNPTRAFYNWLYLNAVMHHPDLIKALDHYNCFTDIEFNPKKSLNCQAYAVALFMSLKCAGVLHEALSSEERFLHYHPHDVVVIKSGANIKNTPGLKQQVFAF